MVAANESPDESAQRIDEKIWSLKEIREAYREILKAWDELFPLHPRERKSYVEAFPDLDIRKDDSLRTRNLKEPEDLNGDEESLL